MQAELWIPYLHILWILTNRSGDPDSRSFHGNLCPRCGRVLLYVLCPGVGLCFSLVVLLGCPVCGVCVVLRVVGVLLCGVWCFTGGFVSG